MSHLTLAVFAEVDIVVRTGGGTIHKTLPLTRLGHSWKNEPWVMTDKYRGALQEYRCVCMWWESLTIDIWFDLDTVVLPAFV